ncbi:MAG: AI-2E family transporter [Gomphosphaeria aponina SAG 52.96 = DSM 107014]|uniref:AI-2E family transporter n=1 Tax=Gomphosphaeria aponina SAG 52.96 = DSM 107014 TaxID=1521640 RepID=A0A941JMW2_9CHRO|nr:AI-2E family transporter [Gomphosphaeria aponina SAG 52.96 = DSM 107014]
MSFGTWVGIVAFILAMYILWQMRQLLLLLLTAIVLANALNMLVKWWEGWGIKRNYAVLLSVSLLITALVGFFLLIVPPLADQFQQLVTRVPQGIELLFEWLNTLQDLLSEEQSESLPSLNELTQQLQPLMNELLGNGLSFFYGSVGAVLSLLLLFALTLMLLVDPTPYRQGFLRLFPAFYRRRVDEILLLCDRSLQGWLRGIFFNMIIVAFLSFICLLILGIPLALAQALLTGIFTFIPNLGPALSVVSPMAIAFLEQPWKAFAVLILYIVIQQLEGYVLTPLVMGKQTALLPGITLLVQILLASFFGFLGLFLALPLTIIGQVLLTEVLIKDILDQYQ